MKDRYLYYYSVEMFGRWDEDKEPYWRVDVRKYFAEKSLHEFDLHDIPNKRRNAKFLYRKLEKCKTVN